MRYTREFLHGLLAAFESSYDEYFLISGNLAATRARLEVVTQCLSEIRRAIERRGFSLPPERPAQK